MKKSYFLLFLFTVSGYALYAQSWNWVKPATGYWYDNEGQAISFDAAGNVYVAGRTSDSLDFEGNMVKGNSMFLAKYDNIGNFQWVTASSGPIFDYAYGLATDANGNSYVAGGFRDTVDFGGTTVIANGGLDIYVAKYDNAGSLVWINTYGSQFQAWEGAQDLTTDNAGNIYITGQFQDSIDFSVDQLVSNGGDDIFVLKLDPSGNELWAASAGGTDWERGYGIAVNTGNEIYVTGYARGGFTFGSSSVTGSGNNNDLVVLKYDANGNEAWAFDSDSPLGLYESGYAIVVDSSGNAYVAGDFSDTASFGANQFTGTGREGIVLKLDNSGNFVWAETISGNGWEQVRDIAINSDGDLLVTGVFSDTAIIGTITIYGQGDKDVFVAKLNAAGNMDWITSAGGAAHDYSYGINVNQSNVYITGTFTDTAAFGSNSVMGSSYRNFFIAEINDSTFSGSVTCSPVNTSQAEEICSGDSILLQGAYQTTAGSYYDTLTAANGCDSIVETTLSVITGDCTVGINKDNRLLHTVNIYPNPFSENATITVSPYLSHEQVNFKIFNIMGQEMEQIKIDKQHITLNRNRLPAGIYFWQLQNQSAIIQTGRLIIH